jgi:hypothetical protein
MPFNQEVIHLRKMQLPIKGISIFLLAVLVLGLTVSGAMPLTGMNNGKGSLSGQITNMALNPQPEPPEIYKISMKNGEGLFSGEIQTVALNPQPEPPRPYSIGKDNFNGIFNSIFSGQIQTVTINPQPEPPGIILKIGGNTDS